MFGRHRGNRGPPLPSWDELGTRIATSLCWKVCSFGTSPGCGLLRCMSSPGSYGFLGLCVLYLKLMQASVCTTRLANACEPRCARCHRKFSTTQHFRPSRPRPPPHFHLFLSRKILFSFTPSWTLQFPTNLSSHFLDVLFCTCVPPKQSWPRTVVPKLVGSLAFF